MFVAENSEAIEISEGKSGVKQRGKNNSGRNRERNGGEVVDGGAMIRSGRDDLRLLLIFSLFLRRCFVKLTNVKPHTTKLIYDVSDISGGVKQKYRSRKNL